MKFRLYRRIVEDYAILYFGPAFFKITRLLVVVGLSVHFFTCIFYRVKIVSADDSDEVTSFYVTHDVDPSVSVHFSSH